MESIEVQIAAGRSNSKISVQDSLTQNGSRPLNMKAKGTHIGYQGQSIPKYVTFVNAVFLLPCGGTFNKHPQKYCLNVRYMSIRKSSQRQ